MRTALIIIGTRPEAIKLAPVARALAQASPAIRPVVCLTGQHRELIDDLVAQLNLTVHHDLRVMRPGQSITEVARRILLRLPPVLAGERPAVAVVQGDTVSATTGALAAFYADIPIAHVEAGLRTGDLGEPFPEEGNRRLISAVSTLHLAPTAHAAENLLREGIPESAIVITGNTGIDTFHNVLAGLPEDPPKPLQDVVRPYRRIALVTVHRREKRPEDLARICTALHRVADEHDIQIVFPVHPSPAVRSVVLPRLQRHKRISLLEPLDYPSTVWLIARGCSLVITDSGGIQEEAVAAGRPVLVLRARTDRPEGIAVGRAALVGSDADAIVTQVGQILRGESWLHGSCSDVSHSLYGDGQASRQVATSILRMLDHAAASESRRPVDPSATQPTARSA